MSDKVREALKAVKNQLEHLMPVYDPQEDKNDPFEVLEAVTSRANRALKIATEALSSPPPDQPSEVVRTERGWAGHYISANKCRFRRNTLLTCGGLEVVVSSVGLYEYEGEIETIGLDRYFETMAFHAKKEDARYHDADVHRQIYFDSPWSISEVDADDKANEMHEAVVAELTEKLKQGLIKEDSDDE